MPQLNFGLHADGMVVVASVALSAPQAAQCAQLVSELTVPFPFDALIGLDVLRECLLVLDGPGQQFILAF